MEPQRDDDIHAQSGAGEPPNGEPHTLASVGELTARELDQQRRLVQQSLLVRAA